MLYLLIMTNKIHFSLPSETPQFTEERFFTERNSLRRYLVSITATTFGVLVALHPSEFVFRISRWCYVVSVIANAGSLIFFIVSLFGRYFMLKEEGINHERMSAAAMRGSDYAPQKYKYTNIFHKCAILGLLFYLLAIVAACVFIVPEVVLG